VSVLTTIAVLREAKAVLERNGWHQGWFYMDLPGVSYSECPVCLRGAVNVAASGDPVDSSPVPDEVWAALMAALPEDAFGAIAGWNDEPERTQAEVLALLDAAVARLESVENSAPEFEVRHQHAAGGPS